MVAIDDHEVHNLRHILNEVFGEDKKDALQKVFQEGSEEEIPGRFFKRPEIAKRTL